MKVSCPSCDAKYTIADDKVSGKKVKVRCKTCSTQILVDGTLPRAANATDNEDEEIRMAGHLHGSSPLTANPPVEPVEPDAWTVNLSESEERLMTTKEIVDASIRGQLGDEVFVWKEGRGDWSLVLEVPELKAAIEVAKKKAPSAAVPKHFSPANKAAAGAKVAPATGSSPKAAVAEAPAEKRGPIVAAPGSALAKKMAFAKSASLAPKAEPAPEQPKEIKPEPPPKAATRLATKRPQSTHDLFAAVDQAGSEIDVTTSDVEEHDASKATGARNENSVLFSLDSLKSGLGGGASPSANRQAAPGPRKKAPAAPAKRLEDLMTVDAPSPLMGGMGGLGGMGGMGGGGLLLSGTDALLHAPPPPEPKPVPKPVAQPAQSGSGSSADNYVPPRKKKGLIIGVVAGIAAIATVGLVFALKSGSDDLATHTSDLSAKPLAMPSAPPPVASVIASATPSALASTNSLPPSAVAVASAAPATVGKVGVASAVSKAAAESKSAKKEPEAKSAAPSSPAISGTFSKEAAVAALSVAASQSTVCKRPEGPWGSGKALVTFAPSGRATTANVTGSSFGGTPVGGCVANIFRRAKIPPFSGDPVTVSKSFTISP